MSRPITIAVLWLLLLVFPLKGAAATMMLACGPGHHLPASGVQYDAADYAAFADLIGDIDIGGDTTSQPGAKCSACFACCLGMAMASDRTRTLGDVPAAQEPLLLDRGPAVAFFTDGPERPPRALLA